MKKRISMAVSTVNKSVEGGFKEFVTSCKVKNLSEKTIEYYEVCMGCIEIVKEYVNMFTDDLKNDFDAFNPLESMSRDRGSYIGMKKCK